MPNRRALCLLTVALVACAGDADDGFDDASTADEDADAPAGDVDDAGAGDAAGDVPDGSGEAPLVRYTETREPCLDRNAERNLYWGDLHVHTAYSFDAYVNEVRALPPEAYAFAQGDPLAIPGTGTSAQLDRPLDFAAVTDHAEYLAETSSCNDPESPAYGTLTCVQLRNPTTGTFLYGSQLQSRAPARFADVCGAIDCDEATSNVWARVQEAAEAAYDRSGTCRFTTFVAYEYTSARDVSNLHRNVIFRNANVPPTPVSHFDEPDPWGFWRRMRDTCDATSGCEVVVIPHNSNMSDGRMFIPEYPTDDLAEQAELAAFRAEMEPLVEIFQHKSASECVRSLASAGVGEDELCDFENIKQGRFNDCGDGVGSGGMAGLGCLSRYSFVRYVLEAGLLEEARLGVNPFRLGIISSTDTHNAAAGFVDEDNYLGHVGVDEGTPETRLGTPGLLPGGVTTNPGGLAGVWAVENSRDALYEAMRRRETFGTSGPRIAVRLFGGYELAEDACDSPSLVADGYANGVPMGGSLGAAGDGARPRFVVQALRDPAAGGAGLERVQIVKGWIEAGEVREQVVDVVRWDGTSTLDPDTCAATDDGAPVLCASWEDEDFDASERAFYYARVVEVPTCRWSRRECLLLEPAARPPACDDPRVPTTIRERAWTSPIWYSPGQGS